MLLHQVVIHATSSTSSQGHVPVRKTGRAAERPSGTRACLANGDRQLESRGGDCDRKDSDFVSGYQSISQVSSRDSVPATTAEVQSTRQRESGSDRSVKTKNSVLLAAVCVRAGERSGDAVELPLEGVEKKDKVVDLMGYQRQTRVAYLILCVYNALRLSSLSRFTKEYMPNLTYLRL